MFSSIRIFRTTGSLPGIILYAWFLVLLVLIAAPLPAIAQPIEEVQVKTTADGYDVFINFLVYQLRMLSSNSSNGNTNVRIQLQLANANTLLTDQLVDLTNEQSPSWNKSSGVPLENIIFQGGSDANNPVITIKFTHPVRYQIRSSADLRMLIVHIVDTSPTKPAEPPKPVLPVPQKPATIPPPAAPAPRAAMPPVPASALSVAPEDVKDSSVSVADKELLKQAKQEMLSKHYVRAIVIYSGMVDKSSGAAKMEAREFLGVAREKISQFEHAREEYDKYLKEFPTSPYADRVRQRLDGVITAGQLPRERLKEAPTTSSSSSLAQKIAKRVAQAEQKSDEWKTSFSGNITELYNLDSLHISSSAFKSNTSIRNDVTSFLDFNGTAKKGDLEMKTRFAGSEFSPFRSGRDPRARVSTSFVEIQDKGIGTLGRFGRQSAASGGVLGRFDGGYFSQKASDIIKVNVVGGFPVATTHSPLNVNSRFFGTNVDIDAFDKTWKFNVFAINQLYKNFLDRRAIGGEARSYGEKGSIFALVDYDVYFNTLNIFMVNGQRNFKDIKTSVYGTFDYRKSPTMLMENALLGQTTSSLSELFQTLRESQVKSLARERTTTSEMLTVGAIHDVSPDFQINPEFFVTYMSGTPLSVLVDPATGIVDLTGIPSTPSMGYEYTYGVTLINNNIFKEGDNLLSSFRYGDLHDGSEYTLTLSGQYPCTDEFHIMPQIRGDVFDDTLTGGSRKRIRPNLKFDYRIIENVSLQLEGGAEWTFDSTQHPFQHTTETYIVTGFRYSF